MRTIHRWHGLYLVEGGVVILVDVILGGKATTVVDMELLLG